MHPLLAKYGSSALQAVGKWWWKARRKPFANKLRKRGRKLRKQGKLK